MDHKVRTGIGGWTFAPWRGTFYPDGLRQADELAYAASKLSSIEINGTYYRLQKRESFAKWRDAVPDDFVFAVKASRYCTNRRTLADAGESIAKFLRRGSTNSAPSLVPACGSSPRPSASTRKISAHFSSCYRRGVRDWRCVTHSRCVTKVSPAPISLRSPAGTAPRSSSPTMMITRRSPTSPPTSSMPG